MAYSEEPKTAFAVGAIRGNRSFFGNDDRLVAHHTGDGAGIGVDGLGMERNIEGGVGLFGARDWPEQEDGVAVVLEVRGNGLGDVVEDADDAEHRSGIDAFAAGLVVERDVAAGDGRIQRGASLGDAVDGGGKLGHDLRLFGIAEVEAIGGGDRRGAGAGHFARTSATACMAPSLGSR